MGTSSRHHLFFPFFFTHTFFFFLCQADVLYKIVKYVQLFSLVLWFICCFHASIWIQLRHLQFHFICLPLYRCFVTHDYLYTNTSFFSVFPFYVFPFYVFPFYVFPFPFYVFPFPLMLMHMLYAHAHPHLFHFTFFCFFSSFIHFLISSPRRFFRLFVHPHSKNETNSCQFQFIRVINTPSITSTSQRHLYFLQSRTPSFYESTKKKINKKNKNDRHLAH